MEEDAVILKVIEAYCTSAKTRHTVNSCKYHVTGNNKSYVAMQPGMMSLR